MRLAAFLLLLLAAPAAAASFQDIAALENRVVGALGAGVGEVGGPVAPIDRRLKLASCPGPVAIEPPVLGALAVACPQLGWRLRVPLKRLQTASAYAAVPGAVREAPVIKRGDPVELIAERSGFTVSTQSVAQEDGVPGGRIRLKSDAKAPVVIAEVVEMGRAKIP